MKSTHEKPQLITDSEAGRSINGQDLSSLMQAVLAHGAAFRFRARGSSMTPFIQDGDVLTVSPPSQLKPALGRVVAFIQPESGRLLLHRLVGRQGGRWLIQGDNSLGEADGLIPPQAILGVVTGVERAGRPLRLGLGAERYLLARLSRHGLLTSVLQSFQSLSNRLKKSPSR